MRDVYTLGKLVGEGSDRKVYSVGKVNRDGNYWSENQDEFVVKESDVNYSNMKNTKKVHDKVSDLNLTPKLRSSGTFKSKERSLSYEIKRKLTPLSQDKVDADPYFWNDAILKSLNIIHEKNIVHCDVHIGNILIENDGSEAYFNDFEYKVWKINR